MKIIQTFWSGNRDNILTNAFGWPSAAYHVQSWALSCQLLRKLYSDVELYTDQAGYDLLIKKLKFPYTKAHVVLDALNHYPSQVWALSKIYTYSLQKTPFIHVDGDVFLWKAFSDRLLTPEIVVQNKEINSNYFNSSWKTLEEKLAFIPKEINDHRKKESEVNVYNFGVFGGNNLEHVKKYCEAAFDFVNQNLHQLDTIQDINFNIFFEQYLFYCMSQGKQVSGYFEQDFIPNQYRGLVNFEDVPVGRNYLHLLGDFKQNKTVCENMSRQLSVEFPDQYAICLEAVNDSEFQAFQTLRNTKSIQEASPHVSFSEVQQSKSLKVRFSQCWNLLQNHVDFNQDMEEIFISKEDIQNAMTSLNHPDALKLFEYELMIDHYLTSITEINFIEIAQREFNQSKLYLSFIQDMEEFEFKKCTRCLHIENNVSLENLNDDKAHIIIPSSKEPYYKKIAIDQLEDIVLKESNDSTHIMELTHAMKEYFDLEEIKDNITEFKKLIRTTVKRLVYQGALHLIHTDKKTLSRGVDANLECL